MNKPASGVENLREKSQIMSASEIDRTLVRLAHEIVEKNNGVQNLGLIGIKSFAAAVLGGFGQIGGAMVGGLVLGLVETMGAFYVSSAFKDLIAYTLLIVVLLIRPDGLFGTTSRRPD